MKTATTRIGLRSRIAVRWSTDPALVGYAQSKQAKQDAEERFRAGKPAYIGTAKQVLEYRRRMRASVGTATYQRWEFSHHATGKLLSIADLEQLVFDAAEARAKAAV